MQYATETNLNNPTSIDEISLIKPGLNLSNSAMDIMDIKTISISQTFYDLMPQHDPATIYFIKDASDKRFYFGDQLIIPILHDPNINGKYFIGITDNNEFGIFQYIDRNMVPISKFANPQSSIDALLDLSAALKKEGNFNKIYSLLADYIDKRISGLELLIGIICVSGKSKGHPSVVLFINNLKHVFPSIPRVLDDEQEYSILCKLSQKIVNIFEKYDWLKDKRYSDMDTQKDLITEVVKDLLEVINNA